MSVKRSPSLQSDADCASWSDFSEEPSEHFYEVPFFSEGGVTVHRNPSYVPPIDVRSSTRTRNHGHHLQRERITLTSQLSDTNHPHDDIPLFPLVATSPDSQDHIDDFDEQLDTVPIK